MDFNEDIVYAFCAETAESTPIMSSGRYRSNLPPTANGRGRLLRIQAAKLRNLRAIEEGIASDEETISSGKAAIATIEETIAHSQRTLEIYESNLAALREIQGRLKGAPSTLDFGLGPATEGESLAVCQRITTYIRDSSENQVAPLDAQQVEMEKQVRELASMLAALRQELLDWQADLLLAETSVEGLRSCEANLKPILKGIAILIGPIRKVPDEVWEHIFFLATANTDINPGMKSINPLIRPISQVCQRWRRVALGQVKFWPRVDVPAATWWPTHIKEMIGVYVDRINNFEHPVFVVRSWFSSSWLSQAKMSAKRGKLYLHNQERARVLFYGQPYIDAEVRNYRGAQRRDLVKVDIRSLCGDKNYALHLHIKSGDVKVEWRPEGIDPRRPVSLTVQSTAPCISDIIFDQLNFYAGCTDITLIDVCPSAAAPVSQPFTGLRRLRLQFGSFASFNIQPLLNHTLEELDLWHSGDETFHNLPSEHRLPALHTLALSVHDANLLANLRTPNLKSLKLYGSLLPLKKTLDYGVLARELEPKLQRIGLVEWSTQESRADAVETLKHVVALAPHLSGISFSSCALDGSRLLHLLEGVNDISSKELTLDKCSIITQSDCEKLSVLVQKLHVYA